MKKLIVLFIISLFFLEQAKAQLITDLLDPTQINDNLIYNSREIPGVDGSPLLFEDFFKGYIKPYKGEKIENLDILFDVYKNDVIIKNAKNQEVAIERSLVDEFHFFNYNQGVNYFFKQLDGIYGKRAYLQVLSQVDESKRGFYKYRQKKIVKSAVVNNGYGSTKTKKDRIINIEKLVYIDEEGEKSFIDIRNRSIQDAFPEYKSDIKKFMKSKKINLKSDLALAELTNFILSLEIQ